MFGEFEFGTGLFGDGAGAPIPPTPTPATFQRLKVECKTLTCTGETDTSLYSIQDPIPSRIVAAAACAENTCEGIASDSQSYSIQDALYFNGTPLTVVVTCPVGATCVPGSFPPTVTYPPGTFIFPEVPVIPGQPINLCLTGCQSTVCRTLPAGSSQVAIQAAVNAIIAEVAAQQAQCDVFPEYPFGTSITLGDFSSYACINSAFGDTIDAFVNPGTSYPVTFGIIGGALPTGITMVSNVGSSASFTGTPTVAGNYNFTLRGTTSDGVSATRAYAISVVGITTASPLPDATIGEPYSVTLAATGISGTLLWGIASGSLPDGLTLNTATGEISGTPTTDDPYSFAIFVQGNDQVCAKVFSLDVGTCLITTASPLPDGTEDSPYSTTLAATDITGTLTWGIIAGSLPTGLTLNPSTGEISGTPTVADSYSFTAQVENGDGNTCSKEFSLNVPAGVCVINTTSPFPEGTIGVPYSHTLTASGITGTLTWSIVFGTLPDGLSLNSATGEVSGTPTTEEFVFFDARVDNGSTGCEKPFEMVVNPVDICGATPSAVEDLVWSNPPGVCNLISFSGGSGTWSLQKTAAGACNATLHSVSTVADICNPGDPYDVTVTIPWDDSGSVSGPAPYPVEFIFEINGIAVAGTPVTRDMVTGPFTDVVMTGSLPSGAANTIRVGVRSSVPTGSQWDILSTTPTLITPLTPPP